jgi:Ca2+-transporting ATPase
MQRPPFSKSENILDRAIIQQIVWVGSCIGMTALGLGYSAWQANQTHWQTLIFTTLTFLQIGQALAVRSNRDSIFTIGLFSNPLLISMVCVVVVLQLSAIYVPLLQEVFRTVPLSLPDLVVSIVLGSFVFWGIELDKWLMRKSNPKDQAL